MREVSTVGKSSIFTVNFGWKVRAENSAEAMSKAKKNIKRYEVRKPIDECRVERERM